MRKSSAFGLRPKFKKNLKFLNANLRRTRLECCAAHAPHREMNPKAKTLADFHFAIHLRTLTQEKLVIRGLERIWHGISIETNPESKTSFDFQKAWVGAAEETPGLGCGPSGDNRSNPESRKSEWGAHSNNSSDFVWLSRFCV